VTPGELYKNDENIRVNLPHPLIRIICHRCRTASALCYKNWKNNLWPHKTKEFGNQVKIGEIPALNGNPQPCIYTCKHTLTTTFKQFRRLKQNNRQTRCKTHTTHYTYQQQKDSEQDVLERGILADEHSFFVTTHIYYRTVSTITMIHHLHRVTEKSTLFLFHCSFYNYWLISIIFGMPSVLWRCWLGGRKGIRPVKNLGGLWVLGRR